MKCDECMSSFYLLNDGTINSYTCVSASSCKSGYYANITNLPQNCI